MKLSLLLAVAASVTTVFAQGNSDEGHLRALNAETLRLRGLLYSASANEHASIHSQAAGVLGQRPALLGNLMASQPRTGLQLAFPADVLADLADVFPEHAALLESQGSWQGTLYSIVEDGVGLSYHHETHKLRVGNQMIDLYSPGNVAGSKCNDVIAASGVRSGNKIVAETSSLVSAGTSAGCSPTGAQKIAVILVNLPGYPLPGGITPDFMTGVFLGNAFSSSTNSPDWSMSDFWTQVSDGKTWVNSSSLGALQVVPVTLASNYAYCSVDANGNYSDNSSAVRQAAYAAADGVIDYNTFSRVVMVLPNNGSCSPIAGVGTVGCWSFECPGDGACNISWTWWRADQIWDRAHGVLLGTHEMGHNLGLGHAGSRAFTGGLALGPLGAAGTRGEYGDLFGTMGNWNFGYYNAQHSVTLGWLSGANVQPVSANGTYTIQGFDTRPSTGVKALKIQRGAGNFNNFLYVAFYPNDAIYLNQLGAQIHSGAIIHYSDSLTPGGKTDLLDFNPGTSSFGDPALVSGQTWVDPYTDLTIGIGSIVNGALSVNVTYNSAPCTAANPAVTMVTTSASTIAGSPVNFTVKIQNQDSTSCASRSFSLSSTLPSDAGWLSSFSPASVNLAAGANANVTLTKTPPVSALGSYVVNAIATNGANTGSSDPNNASLTVNPIPPAPPAAPSSLSAAAQYTGTGKNKVFTGVKLQWSEATASVTQFRIQRCKVTGSGKNASCTYPANQDVVLGGSTLTYTDPAANMSGTGNYKYHVRAEKNGLNSGWTETSVAVN